MLAIDSGASAARWTDSLMLATPPNAGARSSGAADGCPDAGASSSAREREERVAVGELRRARRVEAERRHGTRRFVSGRDRAAGSDATLDLIAERATERVLRRGRVLGREL